MNGSWGGSNEYSDLGFDVETHREVLRVFADYGFSDATTRAAIKARDLVAVRMRSGPFGIGVTEDLAGVRQSETTPRSVALELLHQTRNGEEAEQVRADVERYFRRHFPGRCGDRSGVAALPESEREKYVYIEIFEQPEEHG